MLFDKKRKKKSDTIFVISFFWSEHVTQQLECNSI